MLDLIKQPLDPKVFCQSGHRFEMAYPTILKAAENLKGFKNLIKQWDGPNCLSASASKCNEIFNFISIIL